MDIMLERIINLYLDKLLGRKMFDNKRRIAQSLSSLYLRLMSYGNAIALPYAGIGRLMPSVLWHWRHPSNGRTLAPAIPPFFPLYFDVLIGVPFQLLIRYATCQHDGWIHQDFAGFFLLLFPFKGQAYLLQSTRIFALHFKKERYEPSPTDDWTEDLVNSLY